MDVPPQAQLSAEVTMSLSFFDFLNYRKANVNMVPTGTVARLWGRCPREKVVLAMISSLLSVMVRSGVVLITSRQTDIYIRGYKDDGSPDHCARDAVSRCQWHSPGRRLDHNLCNGHVCPEIHMA